MATEDRAGQGDGLLISDLARRDRSGLLRLILEQQRELIALRAVAEAARAVEESNGNGDQEWRQFCDALDALDAPTGR